MKRSIVFLAALGFAASTALSSVHAQERPTGFYIGAGAGVNIANDTETSGSSTNNSDIEHDTGYVGVLSMGQAYANGLRAEFELGQRRNGIDKSGSTTTGGSLDTKSLMINGFYDFATGTAFMPYIGAGIGAARVKMNVSPLGTTSVQDGATGFAVQGIAGVGYQINESWASTLEYRYFAVPSAKLSGTDASTIDADMSSHSIMIGLRYTFGAEKKPEPAPAPAPMPVAEKKPAPAPAPAPAPVAKPQVARNYIVFFDWNSSAITPEALAILQQAAENAKKGGISRIQATGHADRSGTQAYNLKLSERRAMSVQAQLAKLGIPTGEVGVDWKGELEPLVPTDDGVREPQNRRVEIVFP